MSRCFFAPLLSALLLGFAGCAAAHHEHLPTSVARFFLEARSGEGGLATLPRSGSKIAVGVKPVLTEFDLVDVQVARVELGDCLLFRLTPSAARDLYRLTGANQGARLVLVLNGEPLGARRIDHPFDDGTILIFVEVADGALQSLAAQLRATTAEIQLAAKKS